MSRFELTIAGGEKVLVDRSASGMQELLSDLTSNDFLLLEEIRGAASGTPHEVIIASRQIILVRAIDGDSRQSTTFRPKR